MTDKRSRDAITFTEKYANGQGTFKEILKVRNSAVYASSVYSFFATEAAVFTATAALTLYAASATEVADDNSHDYYDTYDVAESDAVAYAASDAVALHKVAARKWQAEYVRNKVEWKEVENLINNSLEAHYAKL